MDHDSAVSYAKDQPSIQEGKGKAPNPSPYIGGENRVQASTHLAHVAIVGEGGKLSDTKSAAVQAVLSAVIGQGEWRKKNRFLCSKIRKFDFWVQKQEEFDFFAQIFQPLIYLPNLILNF